MTTGLKGEPPDDVPHIDAHRRRQLHEHPRENAMTDNTLDQVQRLVDQLTPVDQVRLFLRTTTPPLPGDCVRR